MAERDTDLLVALARYRDETTHARSYPDLHDHLLALARAGLLVVVEEPINKDTEMHPLVRWQYRGGIPESDRKAFLFTQPTDGKGAHYDIAVLVAGLAANPEVYRIGFGRPLGEIGAAWVQALAVPVEPRVVDGGAVPGHLHHRRCARQSRRRARRLAGADLDARLRQCALSVRRPLHHQGSRHRPAECRQLSRPIKAPRRLGMNPSVELRAGIYAHWLKYKARGEPMPCAVVIGCPPVISYASVQKMPENLDEVCGGGRHWPDRPSTSCAAKPSISWFRRKPRS